MSAALVMKKDAPQTFVDDLESFLYVVLWVYLMYSAHSMTSSELTSFVQAVLDPDQYEGTGGSGKADFLQGRTVLKHLTFHNRPSLQPLINDLAVLFAVRYEPEPSKEDMALLVAHAGEDYVDQFPASKYQKRMSNLKSHKHVIGLFHIALEDAGKWPTADSPVKQELILRTDEKKKRTKTGWQLAESDRPSKKTRLDSTCG
jgi:hypothetical protein